MIELRWKRGELDRGRHWPHGSTLDALAVACVLVATGCSGGAADPPAATSAPPSATGANPGTSESDPVGTDQVAVGSGADLRPEDVIETIATAQAGEVSALVERIAVNQTVSYAGFEIDVANVLIGFDSAGFAVAQVELNLSNRSAQRGRLDTAVEIESRGVVAVIDRDRTPDIEPGSRGSGYVSLRLDPSFAFDDAVLWIGRSDRNRVQIPLGSAGELVTRGPTVVADAGTATDATTTIELTEVTTGWDLADPRSQSAPGEAFMVVRYSLQSAVSTAVSDDVVVLRLPSGNELVPIKASIEQVDGGVRVDDLVASFSVADPVAGDYVFVYTERFGNGIVEVPFRIGLTGGAGGARSRGSDHEDRITRIGSAGSDQPDRISRIGSAGSDH